MKKAYWASILFFSIFVASTFFIHSAFAVVSEGCGLWDVSPECDLSGWMKLFMGDVGVGAVLAVFLHVLAHRSNVKLEANALALKKNSENINKIIESQESVRKARRDYAVQNVKNHLTTILFVIGIMNRLTINYNSATEQKSVLYSKIKGDTLNIMMSVEKEGEGLGIEAIQPPGEPLVPSIILTIMQM